MRGCDVSTRPTTEEPPESHRAGHIAGDLFVSTRDALAALYPLLSWGGLVYIDDYGSWPGCAKAVDTHFQANDITAPIVPIRQYDERAMSGYGGFEAVYWTKMALCCGFASCAWCA